MAPIISPVKNRGNNSPAKWYRGFVCLKPSQAFHLNKAPFLINENSMHARRISVLSNIRFKLFLLFTLSILTTIITQERCFCFFFPGREHSHEDYVVWWFCQSSPHLLYAVFQNLTSLCPLSPWHEWALSTTQTASLTSQSDLNGANWRG